MDERKRKTEMSRRAFTAGALATAAVFNVVPSRVMGANAPSKRITLGCIGMGGQGTGLNLRSFLNEADAQVVAVCDVFASRRERARKMVEAKYGTKDCRGVEDFREVIADSSIDAVVISTPDHWHVPMSLMALEAGKDVFCEKPTHTIAGGRELIKATHRHNAVFQIGLEDRSLIHFHKMVEWVYNGAIGDLKRIDVSLPWGIDHPAEHAAPVPADLNWDLWVGPAPFHPYTPSRTHAMHWRFIRDYGTGSLVDWGSHLIDTAQLAARAPGTCPVEVEGTGHIPEGRQSNVPVTFDIRYRYANGVEMRVRSGDSPSGDGRSAALKFEGAGGWVQRKPWSGPLTASDDKILQTRYTPETTRLWPLPPREHRNFLDCVKSRQPTTYTVETMHRLSTTLHMGNIAIQLGRKLRWDTEGENFVNDEAANALQTRPRRDDWKRG